MEYHQKYIFGSLLLLFRPIKPIKLKLKWCGLQKVQRFIQEEAVKKGIHCVLEGSCFIHPCHTTFKKGQEKLVVQVCCDIMSFLQEMHSYFKLFLAMREDMVAILIISKEITGFFL